ncbi:unnamed protein product [Acanthoscelides obtectus]|uniref:PiggyBac transposable element-derived protein domain-containing protein n=1 Tax=Acanthoscelides obtectus TaxID=200917 RepID=A0A9P0M3A6_ACAOB|nr:unnamed protein product [Acanthoscelides obtectus]CAK1652091.1 hypothetical protein AOBTE_LOCUS17674 [Acanthoscelides obtectus]
MIQPISKTGRNITTDNWFTSYELVDVLLRGHNSTLIGTVRKNKKELPADFINTKLLPVNSSMFGFQKNRALVSYVPRKGKNVIPISSMHHDDKIDPATEDKAKPEIITFYNQTKSGVDVVDEKAANYNGARNTRMWPMVVLYSLLNVAAINAHIIVCANNRNRFSKKKVPAAVGTSAYKRLPKAQSHYDIPFT